MKRKCLFKYWKPSVLKKAAGCCILVADMSKLLFNIKFSGWEMYCLIFVWYLLWTNYALKCPFINTEWQGANACLLWSLSKRRDAAWTHSHSIRGQHRDKQDMYPCMHAVSPEGNKERVICMFLNCVGRSERVCKGRKGFWCSISKEHVQFNSHYHNPTMVPFSSVF